MDTNAETPATMETSNSMPSLDPMDDPALPVDAIPPSAVDTVAPEEAATVTGESSNSLTTTETYISTTDTESLSSSLLPTEASSSTLTETTTTTETVTTETSLPSELGSSEPEGLILNADEIQNIPTEITEVQEGPSGETELTETQVSQNDSVEDATDDPSEALDQFIKKIADEQLSKRALPETLDKELSDNVENENIDNAEISSDKKIDEENIEAEATEPVEESKEDEKIQHEPEPEAEADPEPESEEGLLPPQLREELLTTQATIPNTEIAENIFQERTEENAPTANDQKITNTSKEKRTENETDAKEMDDRERLLAILKDPDDEPEPYLENIVAPADVTKDPDLIKEAQKEISRVDVLVCGNCHEVFHHVEEFKKHKTQACTDKVNLVQQCKNEPKPQVWGFTLWKAKHLLTLKKGVAAPSSWSIYQRWCKLSQIDKDAWITAGQTLQFCSKIANAQILEFKPKTTVEKNVDLESNKENNAKTVTTTTSELLKKGIVKPVKLNNDVTIIPSIKPVNADNSNKAIRTTKIMSTEKQEYAVERIVAKRFNPRRKIWEYQIKWENFASDANTWEPITNLNHCKQMLDQFEEQLKKFKEEKAKQALSLAKGRGRPKSPGGFGQKTPSPGARSIVSTPGRPQRSSKQKAMDQVKAWCGTMSDEENSGGVKRQRDDEDSDSSFEKKMKFDEDSDFSEGEEKPRLSVKRTPQRKVFPASPTKQTTTQIIKNGASGSAPNQILPANILVPDANGVVRINQKQLPSLSTGVYIMSKTAGIIKLDSTTSKVATSGGQTIVKVAPKIGQTQIKIVKKEGGITKQVIHMSPQKTSPIKGRVGQNVMPMITNVTSLNTTTPKITKQTIKATPKAKKQEVKVAPKPKIEEIVREPTPPPEEDSDDGIEPLEFPEDIPAPEPESPPSEFTLDPLTGKIAGKEYPEEKEVVINPEPGMVKKESQEEQGDLDNIVKLAAADITEDDLKTDSMGVELDPLEDLPPKMMFKTKTVNTITKVASGRGNKSESILNKALMGSVGGPKKILNHSMGQQKAYVMQNVARSPSFVTTPSKVRTHVIPKPSPRSRFNLSPQPVIARVQPKATAASLNRMQVYSNRQASAQAQRRVGNTIIRSASSSGPQRVGNAPKVHTVYKVSPKKQQETVWLQTPQQKQMGKKRVISMPTLFAEEELHGAHIKKVSKPAAPKPTPKPITRVVPKAPRQPDFTNVMEPEIVTPTPVVATTVAQDTAAADATASEVNVTDLSSFTLADSENPIFITGDDGTVYQVAGQNEQGQTILITQGADGQQQCLLVTNEIGDAAAEENAEAEGETQIQAVPVVATEGEGDGTVTLPMDVDTAAEPEQEHEEQQQVAEGTEESGHEEAAIASVPEELQEPLQIKTDFEVAAPAEASDQVVAQVVRAEPPSPGGTHKVVVMLPDGNLMVTQVSPEEYASLELE